ncbi:phage shock protein B [Sphingomonas sp. BN140010]|uniref:Phage shock protein B n=1 Tax=Sphingomonas arvum TaxID=2992113 RepID=A0ABT3JD73_9SPHN|nr:phage shock protein B [Sphingomonas sp. BN140010]MCW3797015.1 phage shock protein B [Sphingomonas sp. BN140010]
MNPFEFVLVLMAMIFLFSLLKNRADGRRRSRGLNAEHESQVEDAEKKQLLDEVRQLKERIQVLERITVDKENSLARQIEELRDRP